MDEPRRPEPDEIRRDADPGTSAVRAHDTTQTFGHDSDLSFVPFGMSYPMLKYYDLDPEQRAQLRGEWNDPIVWPAYALAGLILIVTVPGIATFLRERV